MLTEFVKLCSAVYHYAKVWLTYSTDFKAQVPTDLSKRSPFIPQHSEASSLLEYPSCTHL